MRKGVDGVGLGRRSKEQLNRATTGCRCKWTVPTCHDQLGLVDGRFKQQFLAPTTEQRRTPFVESTPLEMDHRSWLEPMVIHIGAQKDAPHAKKCMGQVSDLRH